MNPDSSAWDRLGTPRPFAFGPGTHDGNGEFPKPQNPSILGLMPGIRKWLTALVAIFILAGGAWLLKRSEADRIRDELLSVAQALEFETQPSSAAWLIRLKHQMATRVEDPVTIDIAPLGESRLTADELIQSYITYSEEARSLHVTVSNIGVVLAEGQRRATAKGDAQLDRVLVSGERQGEPRKFALALEKFGQQWRIVHVRISEPRVDQPEARP